MTTSLRAPEMPDAPANLESPDSGRRAAPPKISLTHALNTQAARQPSFGLPTPFDQSQHKIKVSTKDINVFYGAKHALQHVTLDIPERSVMALIGPSGCGKSTYLRCLNRMNDMIEGCRIEGEVLLDDQDVLHPQTDVVYLRRRVG